jgi:hypothetical protein
LRPEQIDAAKQRLVDTAGDAVLGLIELARDAQSEGVRLKALTTILQFSGIVAPRRYELGVADGTEVEVQARAALRSVSTDRLLEVRALLSKALEDDGADRG